MPDAQVRVTGSVTRQADGHIKVEFRLWNGDTQFAGQQYFSTASNFRVSAPSSPTPLMSA
jgi:Tol biopolymer transport system component